MGIYWVHHDISPFKGLQQAGFKLLRCPFPTIFLMRQLASYLNHPPKNVSLQNRRPVSLQNRQNGGVYFIEKIWGTSVKCIFTYMNGEFWWILYGKLVVKYTIHRPGLDPNSMGYLQMSWQLTFLPIASMYGIFSYIYHMLPLKTAIHVGKYTIQFIHGWYGIGSYLNHPSLRSWNPWGA